ncbi:MAG: ATP-binding protein [Mariprofundus sp.]|nr:ATP-binding protein [Mariprofundus sp.]
MARSRLDALLHAQDELNRERDLTARLVAAMPSIFIAVDRKKNVLLWNNIAEETFGLRSDAVIGTAFSSLPIKWDWDAMNRKLEESQAHEIFRLEHVKFERMDGTDGFLGLTISAVIEDGQYNGFLLVALDVSERLQFEHQLQMGKKLESMGELAAGIAHEINTPMQYIGDNVRFLKDGFNAMLQLVTYYHGVIREIRQGEQLSKHRLSDIAQAEQDADIDFLREEAPMAVAQTLEGVAQVSKLVGAMKELSHPGTGEKIPIDINKAIENAVTVSRNEWKYVAEIVMTLDPELPMVHGFSEINQVFLNIIVNAAQAIEEMHAEDDHGKGKIHITTSCEDGTVEIRISDSGPGIVAEQQGMIFDPYFTTKAPGKGTGQGLAISHQIVCNRLGGRLFVESALEQGTSFIIELPVNGNICKS